MYGLLLCGKAGIIIVGGPNVVQKITDWTGTHDGRVLPYAKLVIYLLAICATDDIIARAIRELVSYERKPRVPSAPY